MSETPRTDAACLSREYIAREMDHYTQKFVLADLARQLERELAQSNALYEQAILGQRQLQKAARERWIPVTTHPLPADGGTYLVTNGKEVAPHIRGVIHNNVGSPWDWQYGEAITAWQPLPPPPGQDTPVATSSEPNEQADVVLGEKQNG